MPPIPLESKLLSDLSREDLIERASALEQKAEVAERLREALAEAVDLSDRRKRELAALKNGARAVLEQRGFAGSSRAIFDYCKDLIGAVAGYVALLNDDGSENEVLFLEAGGLPCTVNPDLPMPIRGLRSLAYRDCKSVYHNDFMNSEWVGFMPEGHVAMKNVLFAPLVIDKKTVGIIGLANKPTDFTDSDAEMATGFGELAALALQNSRNLDERIKAENELERLAMTDGLTGLLNRRTFDEKTRNEIRRSARYRRPLCLLFIDIDDFKLYNDAFGHAEGDRVLVKLASILMNVVRETDGAFRIGGEEFAILLPETEVHDAVTIAERVRTRFGRTKLKPEAASGEVQHKTVSIGVSVWQPKMTTKAFVRRADEAMYEAKRKGKNRTCYFTLPG